MQAIVYDIVQCPECKGDKTIPSSQIMANANVFNTYKQCPICNGRGRVGIKRVENEEEKGI
jgi:DnaJ-class molecular chaperone